MSAPASIDVDLGRWVCFGLGAQDYGLAIGQVREVLKLTPIEPVPGTPPTIPGVINLRGQVVTVVDLRRHLGLPAPPPGVEARIVIVMHEGETFGLLVDRIGDISKIAAGAIKPLPGLHRDGDRFRFVGVASCGQGRLLTLLDADALLAGLLRA
ncbi:chemotaxis protein CheW [Solimonas soli]|uniref:chemotaxis protein CheW n=1 Tax=Solimonas soli TaxID=413479 RepID=UPI0004AD70B9|nr:chemotaxis protein CheW [Solimonas soli]